MSLAIRFMQFMCLVWAMGLMLLSVLLIIRFVQLSGVDEGHNFADSIADHWL